MGLRGHQREAPAIDFWQLGVCPDIKQADILEATEDFDLKPLPIDPNYQTIKFPDDYDSPPRTAPSRSRSRTAGPSFANRH